MRQLFCFLRFPRPCRLRWKSVHVLTLADELGVAQATANDPGDAFQKAALIVQLAGVEAESLFVEVAEEVEGLNADVGCEYTLPRFSACRTACRRDNAAMQTSDSSSWSWVGTDDPQNLVFALFVDTDKLTLTNLPKIASLPGVSPEVPATKYKELAECFKRASLANLGIADWSFIGSTVGPSKSTFYFFKTKTDEEMLVPYYDDSPGVIRNYPWPPVVYDAWVEADYSFPLTTQNVTEDGNVEVISAPTLYPRVLMADDINEGSAFVTRKFLSHKQPPRPHIKTPDPRSIVIQVNGVTREIPPSLHGEIIIEVQASGTLGYSPTGGMREINGSTSGMVFEATNMETRRPFIQTWNSVKNQYGLWETTEVTVIPPKTKEPEVR